MSVDRHTLQTRWPNVFAIGDVVSIPLALGKPLPKAGVFANREAEVVAENIAHAIGWARPSRRASMDMATASSKSAAAKRASAAATSTRSRSQR